MSDRTPIWSSALKQIESDLAKLPVDAKAALVVEARTDRQAIVIGTAARLGDGWVLSAEAELRLKMRPSARAAIGRIWK